MRQVQIAAGSMAFIGAALGFALHPAFDVVSAGVGAGLMFAGITGSSAMARMLKVMPWNRQAA